MSTFHPDSGPLTVILPPDLPANMHPHENNSNLMPPPSVSEPPQYFHINTVSSQFTFSSAHLLCRIFSMGPSKHENMKDRGLPRTLFVTPNFKQGFSFTRGSKVQNNVQSAYCIYICFEECN